MGKLFITPTGVNRQVIELTASSNAVIAREKTQEPFGLEPKKVDFFRGPVWPPLILKFNLLYSHRLQMMSLSI